MKQSALTKLSGILSKFFNYNKLKNFNLYTLLFLFFFILLGAKIDAQTIEEYTNLIKTTQVVSGASFKVHDDKFNGSYSTVIDSTFSVDDYVYVEMDEDTTINFMWPFTYEVALQIDDTDINNVHTVYTPALTIHYDTLTGKPINYSSFFHFTGGHGFKVTVLGITYYDEYGSWASTSTIPPGFQIRGLMKIGRDYNFDCSKKDTLYETLNSTIPTLSVSWTPTIGATQYDLEWTFYDDSSLVGKAMGLSYIYTSPGCFVNDATRVTLNGTSFSIPLNYPPGYIFVRERPVKRLRSGQLINGEWQDTYYTGPSS